MKRAKHKVAPSHLLTSAIELLLFADNATTCEHVIPTTKAIVGLNSTVQLGGPNLPT